MSASARALRVAIIGLGVIGRMHASVVVEHPDLELVALVDSVVDNAVALADEIASGGAPRPVVASDVAGACASTDVDLVAICSPSGTHVELAEQAIAAGTHVLIEKPLDTTMARGRRLAEVAREATERGLVVSVVSQHRFDPASVAVARAAHTGGFGVLTSGLASVAWYRTQDYYDSGDWRGTWALDGGGAVMNQAVHTVDLLVWTLGRSVEISGSVARLAHERIAVEDTAVATIRFAGGALAVVHATTAAYPGLSARYQVHGTRGSAIVDDDRLAYFHTATGDDVVTTVTTAPSAPRDEKESVVPAEHVVGGPPEPDHFRRSHARQYDDVVEAIRTGREPGVTVEAALLALATVLGIYVSAALGRPVLLDDVVAGAYDDVGLDLG